MVGAVVVHYCPDRDPHPPPLNAEHNDKVDGDAFTDPTLARRVMDQPLPSKRGKRLQ